MPSFERQDQEGRTHTYAGASERPVVFFMCSRSAVPMNVAWDRWCIESYGTAVEIVRVLDLSDVPRLFRGYARNKVREGADPPGIPILLDWEGTLLGHLKRSGDATNIIVVDTAGVVRLIEKGPPEPPRTTRVARALDELLDRRS